MKPLSSLLEALQHPNPDRDAAVAAADSVEGWMFLEELAALYEAAAMAGPGEVIVEVGNYRGRSTVALALGSRSGARCPVYSFDPHLSTVDSFGGVYGPADQSALYANLHATGVGEEVFAASLDSKLAAAMWPERNIGLLVIDGDHDGDAPAVDFWAWRRHLRDDALVCFDDANQPPITRLLDGLQKTGPLREPHAIGKIQFFSLEGFDGEAEPLDQEVERLRRELADTYSTATWRLRNRLLGIPGVAPLSRAAARLFAGRRR